MKRVLRGFMILFGMGFFLSFYFWIGHYQDTLTVILGSLDPMDIVVNGYNQNSLKNAQELLLKQGYGKGVQHFIRNQILINPFTISMLLCIAGMILIFIVYILYNRLLQKQKEEVICLALDTKQEFSGNEILEKINNLKHRYQSEIQSIVLDQDSQNQELENLAHQMKSTLSTILLNVDQIQNDKFESEIQTIIHQVDRCNEMLNRFLKGHEVRSNLSNYHYEVKNLKECIQNSIERVSLSLNKKELTIQKDLCDCMMFLDTFWIEEAIETILLNAIDFAYKNTMLQICMKKEKDKVQIIIINEGDEPTDIHSIFVRYGSTRTQSEHFGIGLHMVKTICRNHLGDISAYYESNQMKFILELPFNRLERIQYAEP